MLKFYITYWLMLMSIFSFSQDMKNFKLYKPEENAEKALSAIIKQAKVEKKHVFIQIGGNWCVWCARFNDFITNDPQIDSLIRENFLVYHLNYSKENYNKDLLKRFQYPQRFGFPVFIILDGNGRQLHTQNSAYLEEGKGYNKASVMEFFNHWSKKAFDPEQYKNF